MEREQIDRINQFALPDKISQWAKENFINGHIPEINLNPQSLISSYQEFLVAIHEIGHRLVAKATGAIVHITSIISEGNTAGYNIIAPNPTKNYSEQIIDQITHFHGGLAAEEMINHDDHSGCNYDLSVAEHLANRLHNPSIMSDAASRARSLLTFYGHNFVNQQAFVLMNQKVMT